MEIHLCLILAVFVSFSNGAPHDTGDSKIRDERAAPPIGRPNANPLNYLEKFGYLKKLKEGVQHDDKSTNAAVRAFQRMANLEETGNMDEKTIAMMQAPRCGVEDVVGSGRIDHDKKTKATGKSKFADRRRSKRYTIQGSKWSKTDLTYKFYSYTNQLTHGQVRSAIYRAFQLWADVSPLTFTEVASGDADINIEFARWTHSDGYAASFDGPGGTLAHAYFPENGDAHFDDDETFTVYSDEGTNLFIVAAHEFGHSLGLGHSNTQGALMYPWYQGYVPDYQLPQDDIMGIQYLYGMPDVSRPDPDEGGDGSKPTNPDTELPEICTDPFDTTLMGLDGRTYALRGKYIWSINHNGVDQGYPVKIKEVFKGIPSNINAAFTSRWTQRTYFFKGTRFWRFYDKTLEAGYPKSIEGTGLPSSPDAAFVWGGNGRVYIFKGKKYYVWDEYSQKIVSGFPKKIRSQWGGVPSKINAALQWENGKTYFFKGDDYWRFNDATGKVDENYPKSKAKYWMGCSGSSPFDKIIAPPE
ncbi:matrix metalloproteinase-19-like [Saccoglossus kowalevskii]|uniref:Matrix metalloproteinase-19-like n=1 Tax=Saccoglossus kowalevskii TaxID=10224 RepID=A0ABM0GW20_SACKO|nr:PREDICTED: matrix metalloproteinase-19-like [Saccoglossus kowalevskii]